MSYSGSPGHQKLITINGYQLALNSPMSIFPQQELEIKDFLQGGPRSQFYEMGKKIVKGNISMPITIDGNGDVDAAVKELMECAQYPMKDLTINTNYVLAKEYITADQWDFRSNSRNNGFNVYNKMSFEQCCVTKMFLEVPEYGNASVNMDIMGMISKTIPATVTPLPTTTMMRRHISYADCDVYLTDPEYHWDTTKSFNISIENEIEPIYTFIDVTDTQTWTDLPKVLAMGKSHVTGEIKYSIDRATAASEKSTLPTGGWMGSYLNFDLSGIIIINIPRCIAELTQQPIELGLLERTTKFVGLFTSTILNNEEGHFITFR